MGEANDSDSTYGAGSTVSQYVEEWTSTYSFLLVQNSTPSESKTPHKKPDTLNIIEEKVRKRLEDMGTGKIS